MKIMFDLTLLEEQPTGIPRVAECVAKTFIQKFPEHSYELVFHKSIPSRFPIRESTDNITVRVLHSRNKMVRIWDLPRAMKKSDADWILCCAMPGPLPLWDKRVVSVIHDITCWKFPETMLWKSRMKWRALIRHAVKTNTHILNVSETVKREVEEKFGNTNATAICNGVDITEDEDLRILEKHSLENGRYILSVATLEPRKNLKVLLQAFQKINPDSGMKLVLTGRKGWKLQDAVGQIDENLVKNIVFTDYVSDAELNALYNHARVFVSASVYEGFGLPVIEAVRHNLPVLISDIPIYREITGGKAVYFQCSSAEDLCQKLEICIAEDQRGTEAFAQLRDHAAQYTWENHAVRLNQLLTQGYVNG